MKRKIIILTMLSSIFLVGCDSNDDYNVRVNMESYVNTSETVKVNSYNGFRLIKCDQEKDEDGTIRVTLEFNKLTIK